MNSSLADIVPYGKPDPTSQFLVHYADFFDQNMTEWLNSSVGSNRLWKAGRMVTNTMMVPVWFKRDVDALSFKLAFSEFIIANE
jgi:hypothetical protein